MTKALGFRAWNGAAFVEDVVVTTKGIAMRRDLELLESGLTSYILEPSWIVTLWSGLTDTSGVRIFQDDVVNVRVPEGHEFQSPVFIVYGQFAVVQSDTSVGARVFALADLYLAVSDLTIEVVGTLYEPRWNRMFAEISKSYLKGRVLQT